MDKRHNKSFDFLKLFLLYVGLVIMAVVTIYPFVFAISTSLKPTGVVTINPIPQTMTLDNFEYVLGVLPFFRFFWNSLVVSFLVVIFSLTFSSLAGYALARLRAPGRNLIFSLLLTTMMIPVAATLIPLFFIVSRLGWVSTYQALVVTHIASGFGVFLCRQFFQTIPKDLDAAAIIDGSSWFGIYWRIMLPLAKPALGALAIFKFMWAWNDFLWPVVIIQSESMYTLQVGLAFLKGYYYTQWNYLMAGTSIAVIPVLIIFLAMQRYFIQGIAFTGMKA